MYYTEVTGSAQDKQLTFCIDRSSSRTQTRRNEVEKLRGWEVGNGSGRLDLFFVDFALFAVMESDWNAKAR
jgi:hypothetical protein